MSTPAALKSKVAEATTSNGAEVATRQPAPPATLGQLVTSLKPELARALPKHLDADRLARIALTVLRRTPALNKTTPESFAGALMTLAQLGLEPGPTGEAYLVPYGNECTLIIGYRGMVKLFWQSPLAKRLDVQAVYENDEFDYEYGLEPKLKHKPALGDRGRSIAFYAIAETTSGGTAFVVMSRSDIEQIRKRSKAKDSGPWSTDYEEMSKKTCLRRLFKLLPSSTMLAQALVQDGGVRTDKALDAIDVDPDSRDVIDAEIVEDDGQPVDAHTGEVLPVEDPPGWNGPEE